jgi:stage II sporulation protein D
VRRNPFGWVLLAFLATSAGLVGSCGTAARKPPAKVPAPTSLLSTVSGLVPPPEVRVGILTDVQRVSVGCDSQLLVKMVDRQGALTEKRVYRATFLAPAGDSAEAHFRVQVASLSDPRAAEAEVAELAKRGHPGAVVVRDANGESHKVRVGDFTSREEAEALARELSRAGYAGAWVAEEPAGNPAARSRLLESGDEVSQALLVPERPGDLLWVDSAPYRGLIEVRTSRAGALTVINILNVEDYLKGVVPNELSPQGFPEIEALKAQAVAARTYALRNLGQFAADGYDICATPRCQAYKGQGTEHPLSNRAVDETRGVVAIYRGATINALYTSTCGGHTEDAGNVFEGESAPYLRGVACLPERDSWTTVRIPTTDSRPAGAEGTSHDSALLLSLGIIDSRFESAAGLKGVPGDEELRGWVAGLLSALGRQGCPAAVEPPLNRRGSFLLYLVRSLCWEERARRLLGPRDVPYLLQLDDRQELLSGEDLAAALLIHEGILSPDADNRLRPNSAITRAQALAVMAKVAMKSRPPRLQDGEFREAAEGRLRVSTEHGVEAYALDPGARLFRVLDGAPLATSELALAPGDKVQFVLHGQRIALLEGQQSRLGPALDRGSRYFRWEVRLTPDEIGRSVSRYKNVGDVRDVTPRRLGVSGRVVELAVTGTKGEVVLSGLQVRWGLGLKENLFVVDRERTPTGAVSHFIFTGKGWGHGVGLCQVGAYGMAQGGAGYEDILRHYYSGIGLQKSY